MPHLSFQELIDLLPTNGLPKAIAAIAENDPTLRVPDDTNGQFVEPDFIRDKRFSSIESDAILISAPAAVGKSTLAKTLAARTQSLLWDLSGFRVGDYFFTGRLTDSLGSDYLNPMIDALRTGQTTLILDSADEALVRVGASNFEAAIRNLATIISRPRTASGKQKMPPQLVVLGRPDTIMEVQRALDGYSVTSGILHVSFFDQQQAEMFVHLKASAGTGRGVARDELTAFLRNFFDITKTALGVSRWSDGDSFLGYAPVLDALARFYIDQPNPIRTLSEIQRSSTNSHVWELLGGIVEHILTRETEKFSFSFGDGDALRARFAEDVYPPTTQLRLLLSDDLPESVITLPDEAYYDPTWYTDELPSRLGAQFREHPFSRPSSLSVANPLLCFSSVVFRDYAIASVITSRVDAPLNQVREYWLDEGVSPSPFLLQFCMNMHSSDVEIPLESIAMLVDSHSVSLDPSSHLEIGVFENEVTHSKNEKVVELSLRGDLARSNQLFSSMPEHSHIEFSRAVSRATITAPGGDVRIGPGFQDFTIGPDVTIHCNHLDSQSPELRVIGDSSSLNQIKANVISGATRRISGTAGGGLAIEVPGVGYPWEQFSVEGSMASDNSQHDLYWYGLIARRTVKWFVKGNSSQMAKRGGISYPVDAMDSILGRGRASRAFHEFCVEKGYIKQDKKLYILDLRSVNLQSVDANNLQDQPFYAFVSEFQHWVTNSSRWTFE